MSEMFGEKIYDRASADAEYDRFRREQAEHRREDELRGYVDIAGYNVPIHLASLVDSEGMHPDEVCAISDLFDSAEDFQAARDATVSGSPDERYIKAEARLQAIEEHDSADREDGYIV